jgi:hypothetical protein
VSIVQIDLDSVMLSIRVRTDEKQTARTDVGANGVENVKNADQNGADEQAQPNSPVQKKASLSGVQEKAAVVDPEADALSGAKWHVFERPKSFRDRKIQVPKCADLTQGAASYVDGVLMVRFPKMPDMKTKVVVS